jgi:DNA ligase (NAD+)
MTTVRVNVCGFHFLIYCTLGYLDANLMESLISLNHDGTQRASRSYLEFSHMHLFQYGCGIFLTMLSHRIHAWSCHINKVIRWRNPRMQRMMLNVPNGLDVDMLYQELKSISQEIMKHDISYYEKGVSLISDDEYDSLTIREEMLCREYPTLMTRLHQEGFSTRVGGRVGGMALNTSVLKDRIKRSHLTPMLSLDSVHTKDELLSWIQRIKGKFDNIDTLDIVTEPKFDGVSLSIRYDKSGVLQWASTRGDGKQGQDVTLTVRDMGCIPLAIPAFDTPVEVRGEVILSRSTFRKLQNQTENTFSNARNLASGILLRKASDPSYIQTMLQFIAYDIVGIPLEDSKSIRSTLVNMGFQVPEPQIVNTVQIKDTNIEGLDEIWQYHDELWDHKQGNPNNMLFGDFEMDGAVHKAASTAIRNHLGSSNRAPRWAIAYKFKGQSCVTKILGIEVQVGRLGTITPVAILDPVEIQGVTVKRATLHNFFHLQQMMNGTKIAVGAPVLVRRAGEVIPQVVQRIPFEAPEGTEYLSLEAPKQCPACKSPLVSDETPDNSEALILRCGGPAIDCAPRALGALSHAFSRDALNIRGLSDSRIKQLKDENILQYPADLFKLATTSSTSNELVAILSELPKWGSKSVENLQREIDEVARTGVSLGAFIHSLGIRHTGRHTSNLLASIYGTVDAFLSDLETLGDDSEKEPFAHLEEKSDNTKGIGPVLISSLRSFSRDKMSVRAAIALAEAIPVKEETTQSIEFQNEIEEKPWSGLSVVFTGSLPGMSRTEAKMNARNLLGAKSTPGTVTKLTDLVIAGENSGQKLIKAQELGITILDYSEFLQLTQGLKNKESNSQK